MRNRDTAEAVVDAQARRKLEELGTPHVEMLRAAAEITPSIVSTRKGRLLTSPDRADERPAQGLKFDSPVPVAAAARSRQRSTQH